MSHTPTRDTSGPIFDHMCVGTVVDNTDPQPELGRVRVRVPGILQPRSPWAFPMGRMLGVKEGIWWVPRVGASVIVFMNQGKSQHPYYMPGPYGSPGSVADAPEQGEFSPDNFTIRWKNFHLTFKGTDGTEKITLEDLDSKTKLEIDKTTGDYLRDVEGNEVVKVKTDRAVTVEEGDETHEVTAGQRTTQIQGDDSKTVMAGDEVTSVVAGDRTHTTLVGNSNEVVSAGSKTTTAGLNISLLAGGIINLTAGGAVNLQAPSINQTSSGVSSNISTGIRTETFLGSILSTIVGGVTRSVTGVFVEVFNGAVTQTFNGITSWFFNGITAIASAFTFSIKSNTIELGSGGQAIPPLVGADPTRAPYKRLVTFDIIAQFLLAHTHPVTTAPGTTGISVQKILPGTGSIPDPTILAPDIDDRLVTTQDTQAS